MDNWQWLESDGWPGLQSQAFLPTKAGGILPGCRLSHERMGCFVWALDAGQWMAESRGQTDVFGIHHFELYENQQNGQKLVQNFDKKSRENPVIRKLRHTTAEVWLYTSPNQEFQILHSWNAAKQLRRQKRRDEHPSSGSCMIPHNSTRQLPC